MDSAGVKKRMLAFIKVREAIVEDVGMRPTDPGFMAAAREWAEETIARDKAP